MKTLKLILFTLSAGLLYTNTSLMCKVRGVEGALLWLMVAFALTYSVISSLALFELRSPFMTGSFALLDGLGVYMDFSGNATNNAIGLYFGIYTALFSVAAYMLKGQGKDAPKTDAEYWKKCFEYQKARADKAVIQQAPTDEGSTPQTQSIPSKPEVKAIEPKTPPAQPKLALQAGSDFTEEEARELLGIKRAFARITDTEKRKAKIMGVTSEKVRDFALKLYNLQ